MDVKVFVDVRRCMVVQEKKGFAGWCRSLEFVGARTKSTARDGLS